MYDHREQLSVPVMVGVGAAFDFVSGRVPRAPRLLGDHGLEWLYRLAKEPRRLWRRNVVSSTAFIYYCLCEMLAAESPAAEK